MPGIEKKLSISASSSGFDANDLRAGESPRIWKLPP
jgi:hypothetical protein